MAGQSLGVTPAPAPAPKPATAPAPAPAPAPATIGRYDASGNYIGASSPISLPGGGGVSAQMATAINANPSAYPGYADPSAGKNTYTYPSANPGSVAQNPGSVAQKPGSVAQKPGSVAQTVSFGTPKYRW
jgi:hypothetical protein